MRKDLRQAGLFILQTSEKNSKKTYILASLRKRKYPFSYQFLCFLLLISAVFLTNCKNENSSVVNQITTREINDDLGRRVQLPAKIERAVSLAPNLTEIAFAVGSGDRLIGVTSFCDYPFEARKIQKIGDTLNPNIENIVALKPQIVLVSTASQIENFTKILDRQQIAYFVTNPNTLEDIYKSIFRIGKIFGQDDKANEIVNELKKRVASVESRANTGKNTKVFLQISNESLYTIGKESFLTDLIRRAGGVSVTEAVATAYPKISLETALAYQPEVIILSDSEDNREPNAVFKNSPAVKNGKVFKINADLLSRPGPRIVDGLEQIAKVLHPENFE